MEITRCNWMVKRGGFSEGGGYDRMNFTRWEPCGRPTAGDSRYCTRHMKSAEAQHHQALATMANREIVAAQHDSHTGHEGAWMKNCWKCGQVVMARQ